MRKYSPIFIKLYAGFALVVLMSIGILGLMVQQQMEAASLRDIQANLSDQAHLLQQTYRNSETTDPDQLQQRATGWNQHIDARITLINTDGWVIADSQSDPQQMDNHSDRPEILEAKANGYGSAKRFSATLDTTMLYVAVPSLDASSDIGFFRVALSTERIDDEINYLRRVIIIATGISGVMALFVGYWLAIGFVRPLRGMTRIADNYVNGRYQVRAPTNRHDEIGDLANSLNAMADIATQRVHSLAQEKTLLETILRSMNEGVISVDQAGVIQHINAAACHMLKTHESRAVGQHLKAVDASHKLFGAVVASQASTTSIQTNIELSGYAFVRHYRLQAMQQRGLNGGDTILVLQDITDIQRIERMRADFVANASHELKTPITAIRGFAETLLDEADIDAKLMRRFIRKIHSQSIRLSNLVNDLLALSRLENNDEAFNTNVDLYSICKNITNDLHAVAQAKDITLKLSLETQSTIVAGDSRALSQLVTNLIDNAIKYTPPEGRVEVTLTSNPDHIILCVLDTGIGIASIDQTRIFERFYRVDKGRSREVGGTGLGLAIVKHVVQSHGGTIEVSSTANQGAQFTVMLPQSRQ